MNRYKLHLTKHEKCAILRTGIGSDFSEFPEDELDAILTEVGIGDTELPHLEYEECLDPYPEDREYDL